MLKISPSFLRQYSCYDITNGCAEHVEDKILNIANTDLENKLQQLDTYYHHCREQKKGLCALEAFSEQRKHYSPRQKQHEVADEILEKRHKHQ